MGRWRWDGRRIAALAARVAPAAALAAALGAPVGVAAQTIPALGEHRWKHRVVVVLAPDSTGVAYRTQLAELASHRAELAERDVRVRLVVASADAPDRALRRQLDAPAGEFRVVLVGKDGTPKLRRRAPLTVDELLRTIDGMPMGADEARRRRPAPGT